MTFFFIATCQLGQTSGSLDLSKAHNEMTPLQLRWRKLELGFDVGALGESQQRLLAVGENRSCIIEADRTMLLPQYRLQNEYKTLDGLKMEAMAPQKRFVGDQRSFPYVCEPRNAVFFDDVFYVYAECDHGKQLWRASIKSSNTDLLVRNFSDREAGFDMFGLERLVATGKDVLLPSYLNDRPTLLVDTANQVDLKVRWQSENSNAAISGIDFQGKTGLMVLLDGSFLRSTDSGKSWSLRSSIDLMPDEEIVDLKLQDDMNVFILTERRVFFTSNSGEVWKPNVLAEAGKFQHIVASHDAVIIADDKRLWIKHEPNSSWLPANLPAGRPISDIALARQYLYILSDGIIYFTTIN